MKKFFNVCLALLLLIIIAFGLYFDGNIVLTCKSETYSISNFYLAICLCACLLLILGICRIAQSIKKIFTKRESIPEIINNIQLVLSSILLKDLNTSDKYIKKIEKPLADTSFLCWLKGNIELVKGNTHKAKSLFYSASSLEDRSSLGVYSLCKLAVQTKDKVAEAETLKTILQTFGYQEDVVLRLLAISLQHGDFINASNYADMITSKQKSKRLKAITNYDEAVHSPLNAEELLKAANELAPEISQIALEYSKILVTNQDIKKAELVLEKSWKLSPHPGVFYRYINLKQGISEQIEAGYNLTSMNTNSWVGYFEYGKFLLDHEQINDSFYNLLAAYGKCRYRRVFDVLLKVCELLPEPKPASATELLSGCHNNDVIDTDIGWHCRNCGCIYNKWQTVCDKCEAIDSIYWEDYNHLPKHSEIQLLM